MATHSSILAWRIPWGEESGGLQSMGPQRVRHDFHTLIIIKLYIIWILLNSSTKSLIPALAMLAFFVFLKNSKLASPLRSFLKFIILFIYLFGAVLGLHCCMGFSLVAASRGYSLVMVGGPLTTVASPAAEHRAPGQVDFSSRSLGAQYLQFPGSRAQAQ